MPRLQYTADKLQATVSQAPSKVLLLIAELRPFFTAFFVTRKSRRKLSQIYYCLPAIPPRVLRVKETLWKMDLTIPIVSGCELEGGLRSVYALTDTEGTSREGMNVSITH